MPLEDQLHEADAVSNSVKAEAVETVAAPTPALIESERLDLLRRVAEVAPKDWEAEFHSDNDTAWVSMQYAPYGWMNLFLDGDWEGDLAFFLLDEMEKRGWDPTLKPSSEGGYECNAESLHQPPHCLDNRGATRAIATVRAFVAVMEAVKG